MSNKTKSQFFTTTKKAVNWLEFRHNFWFTLNVIDLIISNSTPKQSREIDTIKYKKNDKFQENEKKNNQEIDQMFKNILSQMKIRHFIPTIKKIIKLKHLN